MQASRCCGWLYLASSYSTSTHWSASPCCAAPSTPRTISTAPPCGSAPLLSSDTDSLATCSTYVCCRRTLHYRLTLTTLTSWQKGSQCGDPPWILACRRISILFWHIRTCFTDNAKFGAIEILSTHNFLRRKFSAVCRKSANLCSLLFHTTFLSRWCLGFCCFGCVLSLDQLSLLPSAERKTSSSWRAKRMPIRCHSEIAKRFWSFTS